MYIIFKYISHLLCPFHWQQSPYTEQLPNCRVENVAVQIAQHEHGVVGFSGVFSEFARLNRKRGLT